MSYADVILAEPSVQSYWHLDEPSGNAIDQVGAVDGTYNGATLQRAVSGLLPAFAGNAATAVFSVSADSVTFGDNYDFAGTAAFTAEIWIRPTEVIADEDWVMNKFSGGEGWNVTYSTGGFFFRRWTASAFDECQLAAPVAGTTYHVVATYDSTDMNLYLNAGAPDTIASSRSLAGNASPLAAGAFGGGGSGMTGKIDEFAIYNTALSAARVTAHYAAGAQGDGIAWVRG